MSLVARENPGADEKISSVKVASVKVHTMDSRNRRSAIESIC